MEADPWISSRTEVGVGGETDEMDGAGGASGRGRLDAGSSSSTGEGPRLSHPPTHTPPPPGKVMFGNLARARDWINKSLYYGCAPAKTSSVRQSAGGGGG